MVHVMITHEVKDFGTWKPGFDAHEATRAAAGVKITGVYTAVDNPNMVTVTSEFPSVEAVHGFLNSPELKEAMERLGVTGAPEVKILNRA